MVRAAESVAGLVLVEGGLREAFGSVQRSYQSNSGHPDQTRGRCSIHHRNNRQCGLHVCKSGLDWTIYLYCDLREALKQIPNLLQRCDNNKVCSEWITVICECLGIKSRRRSIPSLTR